MTDMRTVTIMGNDNMFISWYLSNSSFRVVCALLEKKYVDIEFPNLFLDAFGN